MSKGEHTSMNQPETKTTDSGQTERQDLTSSMSTNDESPQTSSQSSPTKQVSGTQQISKSKARNRKRKERQGRKKRQEQIPTGNDTSENSTNNDSSNHKTNIQLKPVTVEPTNQNVQVLKDNNAQPNLKTNIQVSECNSKISSDTNSLNRQQIEAAKERARELKEQLKLRDAQFQKLAEKFKSQNIKIKELEASLLSTTRTCHQFEKLLQQELTNRTRLETEIDGLNQTVDRLKSQINAHEKNKFNNDELVRVLNATLMERETEISILKLKMTRIQTNPSSTHGLNTASSINSDKQDPCKTYATTGRSNSEFCRNSYTRSSMVAESASTRASTRKLGSPDRDASVWAKVPAELTPSKRPLLLEKGFEAVYGTNSQYSQLNKGLIGSEYELSPLSRNSHYKTLPVRFRNKPEREIELRNSQEHNVKPVNDINQLSTCQITNLDEGEPMKSDPLKPSSECKLQQVNGTASMSNVESSPGIHLHQSQTATSKRSDEIEPVSLNSIEQSHYSTISNCNISQTNEHDQGPPSLPSRTPTTPIKISDGFRKIFGKFRRSDSNTQSRTDSPSTPVTPIMSPFKRGANRSTMVGTPVDVRSQMSPRRHANFQTDKPFAEWDTDMLVDWLTMIGLSMYSANCRRWVKCGAHIMNATPTEVDKGLGITNHLHRKKLRLAISELNGDCDKITKAAAKLDYLWVARWLDDIGLPQYKEAFINARVDGRVLNYLTLDDLASMNVKSLLHHASIKCGIRVLRSINFDLQLLKRRATAEEAEQMNNVRQRMNQIPDVQSGMSTPKKSSENYNQDINVPLWTCHRVMEWLRQIDFAEFAPNLRGSGVHGGLIVLEDGFNIDTICSLLSIPSSRTLLRRHLSTFFEELVGKDLIQRKRQYKEIPSNPQLHPAAEIKTPKKSPWFSKLKSSKVAQDGMDEYLCPMYPMEAQLVQATNRKNESLINREGSQLSKIPESANV